jgi:putative ABC transport system permease protein
VGRFEAIAPSAEGATKLPLLTVDRLSFPDVAYFRSDFSSSSLGDLMNQLGREPKNALVSTELAQALQLVRGDTFVLNITVPGGMLRNVEFVYAAGLEYFPQMGDPGPLVVANRGYLADLMGGLVPGAIWLRLEPGAQVDDILTWVRRRGLEPVDVANLPEMLSEDQARLERVGIYGTLSICFLAGALLSVAAFVIYCALSLNKRAPRLAILQALGMTKLEVSGVVWIEYLIVSLFGVLAGIGLGVLTSRLYVPFFPLAEGDALPVPPFVPHIDWSRADWMSSGMLLVLVAVQAAVFGYLAKSRVFETLRMGARE